MRRLRLVLLIASLGATQAQAGIFDDEEARRQLTDFRIKTEARFDQQAKAQLELSAQIQRQADEIARLRGLLETLGYKQEVGDKRTQDFYLDLDSRLRKFETPVAAAPTADPANTPAAAIKGDPVKESQDYEGALNQFKAAKYKEAAGAFAAFVQKYPDSSLAPNAQYWLGNAWYAQRDLQAGDRGTEHCHHQVSGQCQGTGCLAGNCDLPAGTGQPDRRQTLAGDRDCQVSEYPGCRIGAATSEEKMSGSASA